MDLYKKVLAVLLGVFVMLPVLSAILDLLGFCTSDFLTRAQNIDIHPSIAVLSCLSKSAIIIASITRFTLFMTADIRREIVIALIFASQMFSSTARQIFASFGPLVSIVVDYTLFKFLTVYSQILPQQLIGTLLLVSVMFFLWLLASNTESGTEQSTPDHNETNMIENENINESTDESDTETADGAKSSDETSYESSENEDDHLPGPERQHHEFVNPLYVDNDELLEYIDRIVHQGEPWQYHESD